MSTTVKASPLSRPDKQRQSIPEQKLQPPQPKLRARRSPRLIALGVLLACLGGLGAVLVQSQTSSTQSVVLMAHSVARGDVVERSDVTVVTIGTAPGVRTVPAAHIAEMIGQTALVDLPEGTLPGPNAVGTLNLPKGGVEVGLKVASGRLPLSDLPIGTAVQLVMVPADGAAASQARSVDAVVVAAPREVAEGGAWTLDVSVPAESAADVAVQSAREQLVVVRKGGN